MDKIKLQAAPILGGVDKKIGGNRIHERDDLALVSVAIPLGGEAELAEALKQAFGLEMPSSQQMTRSGEVMTVRASADQLMVIFPHKTPDAEPFIKDKIQGKGYTTDQTNVWVVLEVSGPETLAALERICPLDLHDGAFPVGAFGRTVMEHMGAMIFRHEADRYLLASASSSAKSFLHAVEQSFEWVV